MRPALNAKHKITVLKRRKTLLDALIKFIRTHPNISTDAVLKPLYNRTALYFEDCALIKPMWIKDKVVLRLEKYSEELSYSEDYDPFNSEARTICKDVSGMSEEKLAKIIDNLDRELHPEDEE